MNSGTNQKVRSLLLCVKAIKKSYKLRGAALFSFMLLLGGIAAPAFALEGVQQDVPLVLFSHKIAEGEVISELLYRLGVGRDGSPYLLYNKKNWINVIQSLNPDLNLTRGILQRGTTIKVVIPLSLVPSEAIIGAREEKNALEGIIAHRGRYLRWKLVALEVTASDNDDLASLLQRSGGTEALKQFKMDGREGLLALNRRINPSVKAWSPIAGGTSIIIAFPRPEGDIKESSILSQTPKSTALDWTVEGKTDANSASTESAAKRSIKPAAPSSVHRLAIVDAPILERTSRRKRIANPQVEEKAWDISIFDAMKPGMEGVFQGVASSVAAGYFGVRYGAPIVIDNPLLRKMSFFGLMAEIRGGAVGGLRIYWEKAPLVSTIVNGEEQRLGWQRHLLGWAVQIESPWLVDYVHVTPKLGRYSASASLPLAGETSGLQNVEVPGAMGLGLEIDAELARFWYILRGWAARDFSKIPFGNRDRDSVASTRLGVDLFLKGSGFSLGASRASMTYLLFMVNENFTLTSPSNNVSALDVSTAYLGLGASVSW